jgi:hypothetical protein
MTTTSPTGEVSPRPSRRTILRPGRGQGFMIKISEPLLQEYDQAKARLYGATNKNFSQSILMRRSLALYLQHISKMNEAQVIEEAQHLMKYR